MLGWGCADSDVEVDTAAINRAAAEASARRPAPSAATDTVPLETLLIWDAAGAQRALESDGVPYRLLETGVAYAGLTEGLALGVGSGEVHLFFFGDIAALDRAYRGIDTRQLRPVRGGMRQGEPPRVLVNNNMLVILYGGDEAMRQRVRRSLTPGTEDLTPRAVEP